MQRQGFKSSSTSKTCRDCTRLTAASSLFPSKQLTQKPKQTNIKSSKEVTVKALSTNTGPNATTKKRDTQSTGARGETWGDMLKAGKSVSNLTKFDPLRTLNFLIKELQDKLQNLNDVNVQQIIADMLNIVKRMPPDNSAAPKPRAVSETRKPKTANATKLIKIVNTASQTEPIISNTTLETEKFRKQWEESSKKLEANCKQLESLCGRYKREKEDVELLLKAEKDTVKYLRKKIEETKNDNQNKEIESKFQEMMTLNSTLQMRLQDLKTENGNLQVEIRRLKAQIDNDNSPSKKELRALVSDLHAQKSICDQEIIVLKHHLAKVNMEKEKFQTICNLRTKQVEEIQSEMLQLQKIVDENIMDLQRTTLQPASVANNGELYGNIPLSELMSNIVKSSREDKSKKGMEEERMGKEMGDNNTVPSTINSDESTQAFALKDSPTEKLSFKELPSGDSSNFLLRISSSESSTPRKKQRHPGQISRTLSKDRFDIPTLGELHSTDAQANIREMFAELKRQALQVFPTLNIPGSLEFPDK